MEAALREENIIPEDNKKAIRDRLHLLQEEYQRIQQQGSTSQQLADVVGQGLTDQLLQLYKDDVPHAQEEDFTALIALLDKRKKAGFHQKFLDQKVSYIDSQKALLDALPLKDLLAHIDWKNTTEIELRKELLTRHLMEKISTRDENRKIAARARVDEYMDILIAVLPVLQNQSTSMTVEGLQ